MKEAIINGADWLKGKLPLFRRLVQIDFTKPHEKSNPLAFRVFVDATEPRSSCAPEDEIIFKASQYDLILTSSTKIEQALSHACLFPFGSSWTYPYSPTNKDFAVSFLSTSFSDLPGHRLRRKIWKQLQNIRHQKAPHFIRSYSSTRNPIDANQPLPGTGSTSDKIHLYYSMFEIVVENTQQDNYFTEKIIDCISSKSIPIYWGCPNIEKYFNCEGLFRFQNCSELFEIISELKESDYHNRQQAIEENFLISKGYVDFSGRLHKKIEEAIGLRNP